MTASPLLCLERRDFDAAALVARHPPRLKSTHKRAIQALVDAAPEPRGTIGYSRWAADRMPEVIPEGPGEIHVVPDVFDYATGEQGVWHVNFADPRLFVAYGSGLLAQDELQALEHPALGSVREALLAEGLPAVTEQDGRPTPVLVVGVERRVTLDTTPDAARPRGLYGNQFERASFDSVRSALALLDPPTRTNLIAMAAPVGSGTYAIGELTRILHTAWLAFAAAVEESRRRWPDAVVEIHTGFWGCGAFGGNRTVMSALQILAAHLAGVNRLVFHTFDVAGADDFGAGCMCLSEIAPGGDSSVASALARLGAKKLAWGTSDGN